MIPAPIPPLTGLSVLVTRPAPQAAALCERIASLGGDPLAFPAIAIEPVAIESWTAPCDLLIFLSANAVEYGLPRISIGATSRVVAIGRATAASLTSAGITVHLTPEDSNMNSSSE